jgi:hypothetical protein
MPPAAAQHRVGTFFSGGVDASYTLVKNLHEIDDLIFIRGYDLPYDDQVYATAQQSYSETARRLGKKLLLVETNRQQLNRDLLAPLVGKRNGFTARHVVACTAQAYGGIMASIGMALGYRKYYIASGVTYDSMVPYAALSPVSDLLWSTEETVFVHDGADAPRSQKLKAISADPDLMSVLRVCRRGGAYNCGKCEKCVRTMIPIRLLGLSASSMPVLKSWDIIRKIRIQPEELIYYEDSLRLARQTGERQLAAILRNKILTFYVKEHVKRVDRLLFGQAGLYALRRMRNFTASSSSLSHWRAGGATETKCE